MFLHNLKYTFKTLFRNKALIFWTFAFPLIMATFFNMAFKNIISGDQLQIINIAIVDNEDFNNNPLYKETFKSLSDENNEDRLFETKYTTLEEADSLLNDDEIDGYLVLNDNTPKLVFKTNGINQTIIKYVTDEIHDTEIITGVMLSEIDPTVESIESKIVEYMNTNGIKLDNKANENLDYMMIEYYTLIAMTCLYAGSISVAAINKSLPYLKGNGKRVAVSPTKKGSIVLSSMLASYIIQLLCLVLLFIYTIFVLNIDYSDKIGYILLLSVIGSLAGTALGLTVGACFKASDNSKTGIIIAFTMTGCFLAGMMGVGMKYLIDKTFPLINEINPANMITDGFYALYYYTDYSRYWFNIISLLIFTGILLAISCNKIRRARYDSI